MQGEQNKKTEYQRDGRLQNGVIEKKTTHRNNMKKKQPDGSAGVACKAQHDDQKKRQCVPSIPHISHLFLFVDLFIKK